MKSIDEVQLQRTLKRKTTLTRGLVVGLDDLLSKLRASGRFELLEFLPIHRLRMGDAKRLGPISELTVGELVEQGALRICSLPSVGGQRVEALCKVLNIILDGATITHEEAAADGDAPITTEKIGVELVEQGGAPRFISIKVESDFLEALGALKRAPNFSALKTLSIGQFWSTSAVAAPFEQCLTFEQLLSLDLQTFIRKRSMNGRKLSGVTEAIRAALGEPGRASTLPDEANSRPEAPSGMSQVASASPAKPSTPAIEQAGGKNLFSELILDALTNRQHLRNSTAPTNLIEVMVELPVVLNHTQLTSWLLIESQPTDRLSSLLSLEESTIKNLANESDGIVLGLFESKLARFRQIWHSMMGREGRTIEQLLEPFLIKDEPIELQRCVGKSLLRVLGIRPWQWGGIRLENLYSTDPTSIIKRFELIAKNLPKSEREFQEECLSLLPEITEDVRRQIFSHFAAYNPTLGIWENTLIDELR